MRGDKATDALYGGMRGRFGRSSAGANGYRSEAYFRREQAVLLSLVRDDAPVLLDACCGSGLMLRPLVGGNRCVFGIDFNADACRDAAANGFPVIRGDVYALPLPDDSIDELTNCQFFNQQEPAGVESFVSEVARVLRPGGRAILVWRNDAAMVHQMAHGMLSALDRLRGRPLFPQYRHSLADVARAARAVGLAVERREVSCPPLAWRSEAIDGLLARLIGASLILVLGKPAPADGRR